MKGQKPKFSKSQAVEGIVAGPSTKRPPKPTKRKR